MTDATTYSAMDTAWSWTLSKRRIRAGMKIERIMIGIEIAMVNREPSVSLPSTYWANTELSTSAVIVSMKLDGNLEMNGGGFLRLLENPEKACAKSLSVKGEGTVTLMPGVPPKYGHSQKLLRLDEMPKDMPRFRLDPSNGPDDATFKAATGNKFLGATSRKK